MMVENMGGASQKPLAADLTPDSQGILREPEKGFCGRGNENPIS